MIIMLGARAPALIDALKYAYHVVGEVRVARLAVLRWDAV